MSVVEMARHQLRIDTSNPGASEEPAARYVVDRLAAAGVATEVVEPAPGRCSVVAYHAGADPALPALLVHGHLDVVPAQDSGWTRDPFGGVVADGFLWGRGAADMKAAVAAMLALELEIAAGARPRRTVVFAYFADEEAGGGLGSGWIARHRPELFRGATEAVGEMGGFAVTLADGRRVYPLQVGERGMHWLRVTVLGPGGHAALSDAPNPAVRLAALLGPIAALDGVAGAAAGDPLEPLAAAVAKDGELAVDLVGQLGSFGRMVRLGAQTSFVPTMVHAGVKANQLPDRAETVVDCRFVPGDGDASIDRLRGLLDEDIELEVLVTSPGLVAGDHSAFRAACADAVADVDPHALIVPFVGAAGTDAQRLARLGITGYGFMPLVVPAGFDVLAMLHAPDERVPVAAVVQGYRIFRKLVLSY